MERINRFIQAIAHPTSSSKSQDHTQFVPASHGASLQEHNPPSSGLRRIVSIETTKQIASQGNLGSVSMDAMRDKAILQKERVAERSRLQAAGMFVKHMDHDTMCHLTQSHRDVANGSRLFNEPDLSTSPKSINSMESRHLV